jgi:hypothetical protein
VRLAEGCRGDWCLFEGGERPLGRHAELTLNLGENALEGLGSDLVLQAFKFAGDLRGQDVEARREELPRLDHQSAQVGGEVVKTTRQFLQATNASPR